MKNSIFRYETLVHATAGAVGNIVAQSVFYPLDIIKFRKQLGDPTLAEKSILNAIFHIINEEGLNNLYQGLKPALKSSAIATFIYFYAFHGLKTIKSSSNQKNAKNDLIWSIVAGVINVLITNPLYVVNNRLKAQYSDHYNDLFEGLLYIAKTEGIFSLWSGVDSSLLLVINPAIQFPIYEALKRKWPAKSALSFFLMGAISKAVATILTYPLQLVQTRQRTYPIKMTTLEMLLIILNQNGFGGLFEGLEAKLSQTVLSGALMFMTYEKIFRYIFKIFMLKWINKAVM